LYAAAEDLTVLGNTFSIDAAERKFSSASVPFKPMEDYKPGSKWFCSVQDNHLSIYFAPYVDGDMSLNPSLNPALFVRASESVIVLNGCTPPCSSIEDVENELAFTENLGAAFFSGIPRLIRVLTCSDNPVDVMFIQAALVELLTDMLELRGVLAKNVIVIARGQSCLPCACRTALKIVREVANGKDMGAMRIILIS